MLPLCASEIVYNVWVWTSDERGAGTDANVFITLYGKKGKTDEIRIGNATDNFEQGQLDKFKVQAYCRDYFNLLDSDIIEVTQE